MSSGWLSFVDVTRKDGKRYPGISKITHLNLKKGETPQLPFVFNQMVAYVNVKVSEVK